MAQKIAIYGAGGFGREVQSAINQINGVRPTWDCVGFFDDGIEKGKIINGAKVLGGLPDLLACTEPIGIVCAIGAPAIRKKIIDQISNSKIFFPTLIHPSVITGGSELTRIGPGSVILAGSILTVNITIGSHVIVYYACTIGHDTVLRNYCSIMPGVNISGEVTLEEEVFVGTGAKVINQKRVGKCSIIGAGAVVTSDIPAHCTAVGVPARVIKSC